MATNYYQGDTIGNLLKRRSIYRATTGRELPNDIVNEALLADISARKAAEEAARQFDENKRLQDEQIKAMKDADKAAAIQGAANIGQGLLTGYLGYKSLTKAPSALETAQADYLKSLTQKQTSPSLLSQQPTATSATTLTPPSTTLSATSATTGSAPMLASPTSFGDPAAALGPSGVQATSTVAPEVITDAAIEEACALAAPGELSAAGAGTAAGAGVTGSLLSAAPTAAALYSAQLASAPYVDKVIGKDLPNTSKGWKYGGVAGAQIGFAVDVGKKTVNYAKKLVKKLF